MKAKDIPIKKGVPIPPVERRRRPATESPSPVIRAFANMDIGDSIEIRLNGRTKPGVRVMLYQQAHRAGIAITFRFLTNKAGEEYIQVWRIAKWKSKKHA